MDTPQLDLFFGAPISCAVTPANEDSPQLYFDRETPLSIQSGQSPHLASLGLPSPAQLGLPSPPVTELSPQMAELALLPQPLAAFELEESGIGGAPPLGRRGTLGPGEFAARANPPTLPSMAVQKPSGSAGYTVERATEAHADGILQLASLLDMTNATSFVWPRVELLERIRTMSPLIVAAVHNDTGTLVGVAGIDVGGMEKSFDVMSIGSRFTNTKRNSIFTIPVDYCMCRGLLVHPGHQGCGIGGMLHRARLRHLHELAPDTPSVVLSARGSSFQESKETLGPLLQVTATEVTPQFSKDILFNFTFQTSKGVVHLAHGKERDGWKFVGIDVADGGPVWCTYVPLAELVATFESKTVFG